MFYHIVNTCEVALWGVSQAQRIHKILSRIGCVTEIADLSQLKRNQKILLLRADYLFEANVLQKLTQQQQAILVSSGDDTVPVAAWVDQACYDTAVEALQLGKLSLFDAALPVMTPSGLTGGYDPRLRKYDLAHVVQITSKNRHIIENYLYDKSYKGITDFVTKWWWPLPARWVVRKCARLKISPNMVTATGWLLTIFCGFAFYYGELVAGLCGAWLMTFLDTVDGKLARVTLQSSKIGHIMDHGLDIIHPPIWYWCWIAGLGLSDLTVLGLTYSVTGWMFVLLIAYIGGRMFEGLFQLFFNDISIFCWKPVDSYHRLVTARRNPCLLLLTLSLMLADPVSGFIWVLGWSVVSTLMLAIRFFYAVLVRFTSGPLESWVEHIEPNVNRSSLTVKIFTGYPALKTIAPLVRPSN